MDKRTDRLGQDEAAMVEDLLELGSRLATLTRSQIGFATHKGDRWTPKICKLLSLSSLHRLCTRSAKHLALPVATPASRFGWILPVAAQAPAPCLTDYRYSLPHSGQ
jgi:hypothetical protein